MKIQEQAFNKTSLDLGDVLTVNPKKGHKNMVEAHLKQGTKFRRTMKYGF